MSLRALSVPRDVSVATTPEGAPHEVVVDGRRNGVMTVRDDWIVQDLWWTDRVVDRHYFELVLDSGRLMVVYRDAAAAWFTHG